MSSGKYTFLRAGAKALLPPAAARREEVSGDTPHPARGLPSPWPLFDCLVFPKHICFEDKKVSAGFSNVFFLFPSPPQKRVQERGAAVARPRHSGTTLLIHLRWGACCQSERRLRSHVTAGLIDLGTTIA